MKHHSKPVEVLYRSGYLVQTLGFIVLLISPSPSKLTSVFTFAGVALIDVGILISGILLQVYNPKIKRIVLVSIVAGIIIQKAGFLFGIPVLVPLGLGVAFIGAAGLGGKEAYCFALKEGWLMTPILAVLALLLITNIFITSLVLFIKAVLIITVLDYLSFSIRKLRKPYLGVCERS